MVLLEPSRLWRVSKVVHYFRDVYRHTLEVSSV